MLSRKYFKVLLFLFSLFIISGCTRVNQNEKTKQQPVPPEKKDQYRMTEMFSDNKSQIIDLIEGPATFDIKFEGSGTFTARLLNGDGELVDVLADVSGTYKGTKTINAPKTASYILDVKCSGKWSVYRK